MKELWALPALRTKSGHELPALTSASIDLLEGRAFVDGQVVGLVALDEVLRLLLGGVGPRAEAAAHPFVAVITRRAITPMRYGDAHREGGGFRDGAGQD